METELTKDTKNPEPANSDFPWLVLLASILSGVAISIIPVGTGSVVGLYHIPGFGVIGGAIGGIIAGIIQVFSWKISKAIKIVLYVIWIVSVGFSIFTTGPLFLFGMLPGLISFFVVYFVTKTISVQLTKSPVNWGLFGILLVVGVIISIAVIRFLSNFFAMFMSQ